MTPFELGQLLTTVLSLGVAALGIWVAHKSRQTPLHEALYARQLEAAIELSRHASWLIDTIEAFARGDLDHAGVSARWKEFSRVHRQWVVVLPGSLATAVEEFHVAAAESIGWPDPTPRPSPTTSEQLRQAEYDLQLAIRHALGVAGLSKQTEQYFAAARERALTEEERLARIRAPMQKS